MGGRGGPGQGRGHLRGSQGLPKPEEAAAMQASELILQTGKGSLAQGKADACSYPCWNPYLLFLYWRDLWWGSGQQGALWAQAGAARET